MDYKVFLPELNAEPKEARLENLRKIKKKIENGEIGEPKATDNVNNHIHTTYSFSPYSPTAAAFMAYTSGLQVAGIMDHDSVSGAFEFAEAGKILGIATTTGIEFRVSLPNGLFAEHYLNNPDQKGMCYLSIHGIPLSQVEKVNSWMERSRAERDIRNRKIVDNINAITTPLGITLSYEQDVLESSTHKEGGGITERRVLFGLANKLITTIGIGQPLIDFLQNKLQLSLPKKLQDLLCDKENPYYVYDLLGGLKSAFLERVYVDADAELIPIEEAIAFSNEICAIMTYPYLGDVKDSVTGDKAPKAHEDSFLPELISYVQSIGFPGCSYMPSRNSKEQLDVLRVLADKHGLFQVSGEDINTPRQSFICEQLRDPHYANLIEDTWALIGHEACVNANLSDGMFTDKTIAHLPSLEERIRVYSEIGKKSRKN